MTFLPLATDGKTIALSCLLSKLRRIGNDRRACVYGSVVDSVLYMAKSLGREVLGLYLKRPEAKICGLEMLCAGALDTAT